MKVDFAKGIDQVQKTEQVQKTKIFKMQKSNIYFWFSAPQCYKGKEQAGILSYQEGHTF